MHGISLVLASLVLSATLLPTGGGVDINVTTHVPEYILSDNITLNGTYNDTEGLFSDGAGADFSNGTLTNVSVDGDSVLLDPDLAFTMLNGGKPVLEGGSSGSWDVRLLASYVLEVNSTYYMYYGAAAGTSILADGVNIGLAKSTDGVNWTKFSGNPVLSARRYPGDPERSYLDPVVYHDGSKFHMYYAVHDWSGMDIHYATSTDGENWTRYASNPVIASTSDSNTWNYDVRPMSIIKDGGAYRLYYTGHGQNTQRRMALATSTDLADWTPHASNPLRVADPSTWEGRHTAYGTLEKANGTYRIWSSSGNNMYDAELGYLTSDDGVNWTDSGSAVLSKKANTIYSDGISFPILLDEGDHYLMVVRCRDSADNWTYGAFIVTPEKLQGVFRSRVHDAGGEVELTSIAWTENITRAGNVSLDLRWSNDSANWTPWTRIETGAGPVGATGRSLQYRARLSVPSDWFEVRLENVTIGYTSHVVAVHARVDGGPWKNMSHGSGTWNGNVDLTDGDYDVDVRVQDTIGNVKTVTLPVQVDLFPPTGSIIIEEGRHAVNSTDVLIELEANDTHGPITVQLSRRPDFQGASWEPVQSGVYHLLNNPYGPVTIYARFRDDAGRVSETYNDTIVVDTLPPEGRLLINDGAKYTNTTSVVLNLTWTDITGVVSMMVSNDPDFEGAVWQDPWERYGWSLEGGEGTRSVYVRIMDAVGWVTTLSDSIILDWTPPAASLVINQDDPYTTAEDVVLSITLHDVNPVQVKLANELGGWPDKWRTLASPTDLPWTLLDGVDGPRSVSMWVRDAAGNDVVVSDDIVLDTTPPVGSVLLKGGTRFTSSLLVNVTLNATDATSGIDRMRVSATDDFSGISWQQVREEFDWTLSAGDGPKHLFVQLRDGAGLTTVVDGLIILDTTPPEGTMAINEGDEFSRSLSVLVSVSVIDDTSGLDAVRLSESLDGWTGEWLSPAGVLEWTFSEGEGDRTLYLQARDMAGNVATLSDTVLVDTVAPTGTLELAGDPNYTNTRDIQLRVSWVEDGSGLVDLEVSESPGLEGALEHPLENEIDWELSEGDGNRSVHVGLRDRAGWLTVIRVTVMLDTVAPSGTMTINDDDVYTNETAVSIVLDVTDAGSGLWEMSLYQPPEPGEPTGVGDEWVPYKAQTGFSLMAEEGERSIQVRVRDRAGNVLVMEDAITLDTTPPALTFVKPGTATTQEENQRFEFTVVDNFDPSPYYAFRVNDGPWRDLEKERFKLHLTEGSHVVEVLTRDDAGNEAVYPYELKVERDFFTSSGGWLLLVVLVIVILTTLVYVYLRRRQEA